MGAGLMNMMDFAGDNEGANIMDPFAAAKLAYNAGNSMTQAAQDKRVKKLEDEGNEICIRILDQMMGSLEDIEQLVGSNDAHTALKTKLDDVKDGFEQTFASKYSCNKQAEEEFATLFYGEITDALLASVLQEKLDVYKGKVYEPENDITNVMANIISEFLSTAYKTDDKKEKKD